MRESRPDKPHSLDALSLGKRVAGDSNTAGIANAEPESLAIACSSLTGAETHSNKGDCLVLVDTCCSR